MLALLAHSGDVATGATEHVRSSRRAEAARDLLLDLHHPKVPLGLVVVEGHREVPHEPQGSILMNAQSVQQAQHLAALRSTSSAWGSLRRRVRREARRQDAGVSRLERL